MKPNPRQTTARLLRARGHAWLGAACTAALAICWSLSLSAAEGEFRLIQPTPGGIPPGPYIHSVSNNGTQMILKWHGFGGPYQLQRKTNLNDNADIWKAFGGSTAAETLSVPLNEAGGIFRVTAATAPYAGAEICSSCHTTAHPEWAETKHASAFQTLKAIGQDKNAFCLPCHTVGYGATGGFRDEASTPGLLGVQCENCHGPAGLHAEGGAVYPVSTANAMLCGGCHNGYHHPTYDEWLTAGHSQNVIGEEFITTNGTANISRMNSCGACHSGAVRFQMLEAYDTANRTNVIWPSGHDAAETPVTCVTCHDTHGENIYTNAVTGTVYTNQLRNPVSSYDFMSYNTGTNFAANYKPNINLCGQCHNARGASATTSTRPPHHSPQYNMLIGLSGITNSGTAAPLGAHRNNPLQCVNCHTHGHNEAGATPENPAYTGHGFRWTLEACQTCHTNSTGVLSATNLLFTTQAEVAGQIALTKSLLDTWATTYTSTWAQTNQWTRPYGALAWEFSTPGQLSQNSTGTLRGPTATEQATIPTTIKQARFNLYLVEHDGSKGIHNAPYVKYLLQIAQEKVNEELAKP